MLDVARARSASLRAQIDAASGVGATLIRLHCPLDLEDPWTLLSSPELEGRRIAGWASEERCFLAIDMVRRYRLDGDGRFDEAGQIWSRLTRGRVEAPLFDGGEIDESLPWVLSGFAFSTQLEGRSEHWSDWGDGALWAPEVLIHRSGGRTFAALTAEIDDADGRLQGALKLLERLLYSSADALSEPPTAGRNHMTRSGRGEAAWQRWRDRVERVKGHIQAGRMEKVVLARAEHLHALEGQRFDPLATAIALRERQAGCTTFFIRRAGGAAFVGATPESLIRLQGREARTVALAGTRSRGWDDDNDAELGRSMFGSPKDRREQALVADSIQAALEPVMESLEVPEAPDVARFADVQHLRTQIRGRIREGVTAFELIARLHPTPAVGGLPHELALEWLDQHEGLDRGWYAGPIGWVDARGDASFMVAIRSALLQGSHALSYAGCGLVARSDAREEWEETIFKMLPINRGLALAAPPAGALEAEES